MLEINPLLQSLKDIDERTDVLRGIFDYAQRKDRLAEVELELAEPSVWDDPERAQELGRERAALETVVKTIEELSSGASDAADLLEMAAEEDDEATVDDIRKRNRRPVRWHRGPGLGGDAAAHVPALGRGPRLQDRADGGLRRRSGGHQERHHPLRGRVRLRLAAHRDRRAPPGAQVAVRFRQPSPHLVHLGVRLAGDRRQTVEIEINPADLRTDTFRASGAGGQHVNKTDSAVRLTHEPSGIVVQCQNDARSTRTATRPGSSCGALYELEMQKRKRGAQAMEDSKSDIGWGSQIRSYVLDDQSRIKDLRTNVETGNTQAVLDGDIDHVHRGQPEEQG